METKTLLHWETPQLLLLGRGTPEEHVLQNICDPSYLEGGDSGGEWVYVEQLGPEGS